MKYLKISTLAKGLHDKDELLLHAVFQIVVDFVEKEDPERVVDWNADKINRAAWKEIKELYTWWKQVRPNRRSPLDNKKITIPPFEMIRSECNRTVKKNGTKKYGAYYRALGKLHEMEIKWHQEDQRNLHRLVNVRDFLWT